MSYFPRHTRINPWWRSINTGEGYPTLTQQQAPTVPSTRWGYQRFIWPPRSEATGIDKRSPAMPPPPTPPFRYDFFVSPTGSAANDGLTVGTPWTLAYALAGAGGLIVPGKHIGIMGGQYIDSGPKKPTVNGSAGNDIIWRNYNGQHVEFICDSLLASIQVVEIEASYNTFWGIDAWRKHTDRFNYPGPGSVWWIKNASATGVKLIHCVGHEGSNSYFIDSDTGDTLLYGCISYHAGTSTDPRAHGFYVHHKRDSNHSGSRLQILNHISFDHLGNCGQIFASGAPEQMDDIDIDFLVAWGGGRVSSTTSQQNLTFGGTDSANIPLRGSTFRHIISRNPSGFGRSCLRMYDGGAGTGQDAILEDSYLVGGTTGQGVGRLSVGQMGWTSFAVRRNTMINLEQTQLIDTDDDSYTGYTAWEDNVYYGSDPAALRWRAGGGFTDRTFAGWKAFTGLGNTVGHLDVANASLPTSTKVFVQPTNTYEYGRGIIVYFNWAHLGRIPVDLTGVMGIGDQIVVRNVQDFFGAPITVYDAPSGGNVVTTWTGVPVYLPTDGVPAPAIYGFNNAALNSNTPIFDYVGGKTAPDFDCFIVSTS